MNIGYYFWGFLGDRKFNNEKKEITAPDGNQIYSWAIIRELQNNGHKVKIFHDRDKVGYKLLGKKLFSAFCTDIRNDVYNKCKLVKDITKEKLDVVLIEWRWIMEGRNDSVTEKTNPKIFQPDYRDMVALIKYCNKHKIPFVIYDLDYKLTREDVIKFKIKYIMEPGDKLKEELKGLDVNVIRCYQPFDFNEINYFSLDLVKNPTKDIIYVGNEYERNWAVRQYLPKGTNVWGNWLEPSHIKNSEEFMDILNFHNRVNAIELPNIYHDSIATVLLAKRDYAENHFITPRLTESIFYGTVPFFIQEFGKETIAKFAGKYADFLTVKNKKEVEKKVKILKKNYQMRVDIIKYLRDNMKFTDVKFYVNELYKISNS